MPGQRNGYFVRQVARQASGQSFAGTAIFPQFLLGRIVRQVAGQVCVAYLPNNFVPDDNSAPRRRVGSTRLEPGDVPVLSVMSAVRPTTAVKRIMLSQR